MELLAEIMDHSRTSVEKTMNFIKNADPIAQLQALQVVRSLLGRYQNSPVETIAQIVPPLVSFIDSST